MRAVICLLTLLFLSSLGYSATYYIPDDYGSIQAAIDASTHGDTLIVKPGTYYEHIALRDKSITLISEQGAANTIIDGYKDGQVFWIYHFGTESTVVDGFTIQNGWYGDGAGMAIVYSSPTITNCIFQGNSTYNGHGAGMTIINSSPTITNCIFHDNSAIKGHGGGMRMSYSFPVVSHCTFQGNSASGFGGGISNYVSAPVLINCTFQGNSASYGGGMESEYESAWVINCTFEGNSAVYGGGVCNYCCEHKVRNCILWNNIPDEVNDQSCSTDVRHSCIQGGYPGVGNIASDPLFLNPANTDLRLRNNSPCIDAGDNYAPYLPSYDFEGDARIQDGNGDGLAIVDMGIDERSPCPEIWVDDDWSGSDYGDSVGGHVFGHDAFDKIQDGIVVVATGGTVHVADGLYTGEKNRDLNFNGRPLTVKSENGPDTCIIDCEQSGRGFYFCSGEGLDSRVEGLTIRNGYEGRGGGIRIVMSSPTVTQCVLENNTATVGGGVCIDDHPASPVVEKCTFLRNSANQVGGGVGLCFSAMALLTDCTFQENSAAYSGGGMCNYGYCSPVVIQCTFQGNLSNNGGGMCNWDNCSPVVTQCTFHGNSSSDVGGAISNYLSDPVLTNCILWGDMPDEIYDASSTPVVTYSCIEGGYPGTGNIDSDPLFFDPTNYDLHLSAVSPCIDAGDNGAAGIPDRDFEGDHRIISGHGNGFPVRGLNQDAIVDMGVDEFMRIKKFKTW